jgi:hypothetical protein
MFLIYTCGGSIAVAQFFPGRVTGSVRDAQGAAVAGATVKLSNLDTSQERTATSDQNGEFNFPELPLGTFQLTVSKDGFRTSQINDIVTSQRQVNNINPVLAVGTVSSKIEVNSAPALIQTETNESGGQLTEEQVESLPIGNSDYTRLALVLPGVTQNSNFAFAQYSLTVVKKSYRRPATSVSWGVTLNVSTPKPLIMFWEIFARGPHVHAVQAALKLLGSVGYEKIAQHISGLTKAFTEGALALKIKIKTPTDSVGPLVVLQMKDSDAVVKKLALPAI